MSTKTTRKASKPKAEKVKREKGTPMKPFLINLPPDLIATAKKLCAKNGLTMRGHFRDAIAKAVEKLAA
jgi:hypothetical protein